MTNQYDGEWLGKEEGLHKREDIDRNTQRLSVPNGWLYYWKTQVCFVPDPYAPHVQGATPVQPVLSSPDDYRYFREKFDQTFALLAQIEPISKQIKTANGQTKLLYLARRVEMELNEVRISLDAMEKNLLAGDIDDDNNSPY